MPRRLKIVVAFVCLLLAAGGALLLAQSRCPASGLALTTERREFLRLKNRDATPRADEFDAGATLAALVGGDRGRFDERRAARVEGYVVGVGPGGIESANCFSRARRDTHIYVAARADAGASERVVVEVTPRARDAAARSGADWSEAALRRALVGRRCRFEGWLLYDREHAGEAEANAPGRAGNWRATAWEIHPATRIEVIE